MGSNVRDVMRALQEGGLTAVQAAGLVGRFQQESGMGLNPTAHGDLSLPGGSHGIGQWNRDRLSALKEFAGANWTDPTAQARFALHELDTTESAAGKALRNANTYQEAVNAAMDYERPKGWTPDDPTLGHGYHNALKNARALMGMNLGSIPTNPASMAMAPSAAPSMPGIGMGMGVPAPTGGIDLGSMWHGSGVPTPSAGPGISSGGGGILSSLFGGGGGGMPGMTMGLGGSWRGAGATPGGMGGGSGKKSGGISFGGWGDPDKDKDSWGGAATRAARAGYL